MDIVLKTKNLFIGYHSKNKTNFIAKSLNLNLKRGQMVCLLGKNGVGKSTLLKTLSKTHDKLKGEIYIDNHNLDQIVSQKLSKKISLVLTERIPDSELTVFELIALGRQPYTNWLGKITHKDSLKIKTAMQQLKISELSENKNYELSDGQLQKVMIARALVQDTKIIILDEPTAHLDMHHKIEIFKLLQALIKKNNKTILLSTHEVNLALKIADKLWLMTPDEFITGTVDKLIKTKEIEKLFPANQILFNANLKQFVFDISLH